uniref:Uncharacterized protein n=1 Tax=Iconisemion striatum TaxID=60296 RepID=A0A1A7YDB2_9TELE
METMLTVTSATEKCQLNGKMRNIRSLWRSPSTLPQHNTEAETESALLQTTSSSRILKRDFKPVQVFKPFSDNGGRKPLHGDGDGLLYTILPWVGTSRLTKDVNTIWWCLENITDILADITAQMADNPEIKALRAMAMQHQVALDLLLHLKVVCVKS